MMLRARLPAVLLALRAEVPRRPLLERVYSVRAQFDDAPRVQPVASLTAWRGAVPSEATARSTARATSRRRPHIAANREPAGAHRL